MNMRQSYCASSCGSASRTASARSAAGRWRSARRTSGARPSASSCCARRRSCRSACATRTTSCAAASRRTRSSYRSLLPTSRVANCFYFNCYLLVLLRLDKMGFVYDQCSFVLQAQRLNSMLDRQEQGMFDQQQPMVSNSFFFTGLYLTTAMVYVSVVLWCKIFFDFQAHLSYKFNLLYHVECLGH